MNLEKGDHTRSAAPNKPLRVSVIGAAGRMGWLLIDAIKEDGRFQLHGCLDREGHPQQGHACASISSGDILLDHDPHRCLPGSDVIIDFSLPEGTRRILPVAVALRVPFLSGTTGLTETDSDSFRRAAETIPVLYSANMSLGINLLVRLLRTVVPAIPADYDIEITERHHRHKVDSPSGTAILLAETIRSERERRDSAPMQVQVGRPRGVHKRSPSDLVVHAVRGGGIIGEHHVQIMGETEEIILSHRALNRSVFVRGALEAAAVLPELEPGLYSMDDIIGTIAG